MVGIFTQPPRRAGRGGKVTPTPIAQAARQAGREVVECPNINADEVVAEIHTGKPEVICVADFGQMIRQPVLDSAPRGVFNVHASLLPELRGAAPIQWALIHGYKRTGVTTFRIVREMDAGPIYLQAAAEIALLDLTTGAVIPIPGAVPYMTESMPADHVAFSSDGSQLFWADFLPVPGEGVRSVAIYRADTDGSGNATMGQILV